MEKISFNIRKMNVTDMLTIYDFVCLLEDYTFDKDIFNKIFLNNLNNEHFLYYVIELDNGTIIGYMSCHIQWLLHHCGKVAEIQELFILDEYRNEGIGSKLIAVLELELIERACVSLEVTAQNKRTATHHFYVKCGLMPTHLKFTKKLA